jgi:hypothetical protein
MNYYRPQDKDQYAKIDITKRLDDHLSIVTGANIFTGEDNYRDREFGMLDNDDNVFLRMKYNF